MLLTKEVEIKLNSRNIKHFESLNYEIPKVTTTYYDKNGKNKGKTTTVKRGTTIVVKVEDLVVSSSVSVDCECDKCYKKMKMPWRSYIQNNHDGKIYCCHCAPSIFNTRENNPNWNPNKTDEERRSHRDDTEYNVFVKSVLARDNYTCQRCGKSESGKMEVHHLDGFNWCKEKRADVTNGITLCNRCHANFHYLYGRGNNTKNQYMCWINAMQLELNTYNGQLPTARKVYCVNDNIVIDNVCKYAKEHNLDFGSIYDCCNGKQNTYRRKIYLWYNEYLSLLDSEEKYNEVIRKRMMKSRTKAVVCINQNLWFQTIKDASIYFKIDKSGIQKCCQGTQNSAGKSKNGEKLIWKYATDVKNFTDYTLVCNINSDI